MKKIIAVIIAVFGILLAALGVSAKVKDAAAISIIGAADGPTAILVAGKFGGGFVIGAILVGIILVVAGIVIYRKVKKK